MVKTDRFYWIYFKYMGMLCVQPGRYQQALRQQAILERAASLTKLGRAGPEAEYREAGV